MRNGTGRVYFGLVVAVPPPMRNYADHDAIRDREGILAVGAFIQILHAVHTNP